MQRSQSVNLETRFSSFFNAPNRDLDDSPFIIGWLTRFNNK